jgi:dynein heavy chain
MAAVQAQCEAQLALAEPSLVEAQAQLQTLKKGDFSELKSMKAPPNGIKLVLSAVCVMKNVAPKLNDDGFGKKFADYWGSSKRMLNDPRFLTSLIEYDKDSTPPEIMAKVTPPTQLPLHKRCSFPLRCAGPHVCQPCRLRSRPDKTGFERSCGACSMGTRH